ncbi:TonB-dependent receptor [Pseudocolwellia agarivorans]|uniref:TonB-dependent receptor n=1 Tax=Pseudocolwellia agarivorans TaxID=1911682 RepID=UPI000986BE59|nr:TonB-dependent receptor [Pseudocolwellia agarivorans]
MSIFLLQNQLMRQSSVSSKKVKFTLNLLTAALVTAMFPAIAQDTDTQVPKEKSKLEVIEVTAQKRTENLQEIPIAVSALNEDALAQSGFDGVEDLSFLVPSLQFGNFGPTTFLNIRGVGSENTTGGSDPGVAMHVDGVYVGRPVGALFSAFDVTRVEVLRGPQGTLYGRNATGGSVNLITNKPDDYLSGKLDATIGNYNLRRVRGAINIPINDSVTARVVAFNEDRDGFTENLFPGGTEANDSDNSGIRGHLNIELSDSTYLLLSATHIENNGIGSQAEQRDPYSTGVLFGPGPEPLRRIADENGSPLINNLEAFKETKDQAESQESTFDLYSATLDWEGEYFSIKSITAIVESDYTTIQDSDSSAASLQVLVVEEDAKQFSQEIQFISPANSEFRWIAGLFYFTEEVDRFSSLIGPRFDAVTGFLTATVPNFNENYSFRIGGDIETTSYAAFVQGTYNLSETVSVTAGLRYTDDEKEGFNRNIFFAPQVVDPVEVSSSEVTGKLAIDWNFQDNALLYASYSKGYKSGGVSQQTVAASGASPIFNPEFVDTYEVGYKSQLLEDTMQLNLATYYSDYTDLQFQVFGDFGPEAGNAGAATIKGLEAEVMLLLGDIWSVDGSFAYTDAEYDELITGPGQNFAGNQLTRTPELAYNLGVNAEWEFSDHSLLIARLEGSYTDEIYYEFTNTDASLASDYYNINFRLLWTSADEKYFSEFYVTNLTDEVQETSILVGFSLGVAPGEVGAEYVTYNAPRQFGLTVGYRFE